MLKTSSETKSSERRQSLPRNELTCTATLCADNAFHRVQLADVSRTGCKIFLNERLRTGERVQIALEAFHSLGGTIRWQRDGKAGIQFLRPLSDKGLDAWQDALARARARREAEVRKVRRNFWGEIIGDCQPR